MKIFSFYYRACWDNFFHTLGLQSLFSNVGLSDVYQTHITVNVVWASFDNPRQYSYQNNLKAFVVNEILDEHYIFGENPCMIIRS